MYIPEFVCGIVATLATEFLMLLALAFYLNLRNRKNTKQGGKDDA